MTSGQLCHRQMYLTSVSLSTRFTGVEIQEDALLKLNSRVTRMSITRQYPINWYRLTSYEFFSSNVDNMQQQKQQQH